MFHFYKNIIINGRVNKFKTLMKSLLALTQDWGIDVILVLVALVNVLGQGINHLKPDCHNFKQWLRWLAPSSHLIKLESSGPCFLVNSLLIKEKLYIKWTESGREIRYRGLRGAIQHSTGGYSSLDNDIMSGNFHCVLVLLVLRVCY